MLRYPHPALKREAAAVTDTDLAARVAADLVDTMRAFTGCVGLAAPQIGEAVRIVVVDVTDHRRATAAHGLLVLVNPTVVGRHRYGGRARGLPEHPRPDRERAARDRRW